MTDIPPTSIFSSRESTSRSARVAAIKRLLDAVAPDSDENLKAKALHAAAASLDREATPLCVIIINGDSLCVLNSEEAWDRAAVEREDIFLKRFGLDWPRAQRQELIAFKHAKTLSDREIRLLRASGTLHRHKTGVRTSGTLSVAILGSLMMLTTAILLLMLLIKLEIVGSLSFTQACTALAISAVLLLIKWAIYRFYILPWRICRRTA